MNKVEAFVWAVQNQGRKVTMDGGQTTLHFDGKCFLVSSLLCGTRIHDGRSFINDIFESWPPPKPTLLPLNAEEMEDLVGQMIWHDGCKRMVLSAYDNGAYLCVNGSFFPMDSERLLKFASYDKAGEKPVGVAE